MKPGLLLLLGLAIAAPALADVTLPRATLLPFEWTPPPQDSYGYQVTIDCDDGDRLFRVRTAQPRIVIHSLLCGEVRLWVAAIVDPIDGRLGPPSEPSERVTLSGPAPARGALSGARGAATTEDFDGDGFADVLLRSDDARGLALWLPVDGQDLVPLDLPGLPEGSSLVGSGDIDGDGTADLLILDTLTRALGAWLFVDGLPLAEADLGSVPEPWSVAAATDHDGDGRADVLLFDPTTGSLQVWSLDGLAVVRGGELDRRQQEPLTLVSVRDFDGDGRADLLWRDFEGDRVDLWLLEGTHVRTAAEVPDTGLDRSWTAMQASGDFDGDGVGDLVWQNRRGRDRVMWFFEDGALREVVPLPEFGPRREIAAARDLDGDGRTDLLLLDQKRPRLRAFLMDGAQVLDRRLLGDIAGWEAVELDD